jgi:hypothetical protein
VLQSAGPDAVVAPLKTGFRDLQVRCRQLVRSVVGKENLLGSIAILGFQTKAFARLGINAEEQSAAFVRLKIPLRRIGGSNPPAVINFLDSCS